MTIEPVRPAAAVFSYLRDFSDSIAGLPGARLVELGHLRAVISGRAMFNRVYDAVYPTRVGAEDVALVANLARRERVRPAWILDARVGDGALAPVLEAAGFGRTATWSGMWRGDDSLPVAPLPDGVVVETVTTEAGLKRWARVCAEVEGFSGEQEAVFTDLFMLLADEDAGWTHTVASIDGKPVGTASLLVANGVGALDWVDTDVAHRRRGIAGHLATQLLEKMRGSFDIAVLTSTPEGESLYRRIGFTECCRINAWRMRE